MIAQLPLIIVNPASASGKTGRLWPELVSTIRTHFGPFEVAFTKEPGDGERLAALETRNGRSLIIACGGDGTISEVANGILHAGGAAELGIMPRGTGGDFRRTLEVPLRPAEAARALRDSQPRRIDVGRASFLTSEGKLKQRYFVNLASFGMSGRVIERSKESAELLGGRLAFYAATLQTTFTFTKPEVWLEVDDQPVQRLRIANVCIANGRYFGGGMKVAPEAKLNDSLFDVVAIGDLSVPEILLKSYRLYNGTHLSLAKVGSTRATKVKAGAVSDGLVVKVELDGEVVGQLPATFEILPQALTVRSPR